MSKYSRIIFFVLAFLLVWSFLNPKNSTKNTDDVILEAKSKIAIGSPVVITVKNNSGSDLTIPVNCPKNPLIVERYMNGEWSPIGAESSACKAEDITIAAGKKQQLSYTPWNQGLFDEIGRYRISLEQTIDEKTKSYAKELEITSPGIFRTLWSEGLYKPIFNTLIFLISFMPNHSLGLAIIMLTFIIKLILLAPNHKALKAQKAMQKVQPQLDALKKKYKENPQKLAEETMNIWKKYKVNPMSSCLPMLIQFPVLIALFYVVKNGLDFINPQFLYSSLQGFDTSLINPVFLGLIDLTKVNILALPIIVGLLQFGQMRLTLGKGIKSAPEGSPAPMMNKTMIYFMPILIAFFTASLPAAVGFYWGASTIFGIGQQIIVNRSKD
ncbi:YidC/Oxa1 family membrane protein insertase [Patescibacteria group bacterium]|nr:YidC/Oxa1 family membrane protein insertase [Patescibacteria group bacterium]MBU1016151.1 YidC/Oxa1 family membrane protein insertase [Patescibacteria group bacterium]MBU1938330.1 YidC/Oxa1 family membrane protein insertase [Patescibacteria group bacterium]